MWETHTVGSDISQVFSTDRCWGPSPEATVRVAKEHRAAHVSMSLSSQPVISFSDAILHLKAVSRRVLLLPVIRLACSTVERWQILRVHYQKIDGLHITWPISQWRKGNSLWVGSFTGTQNWSVLICFSSHLSHTLIPPPGSTVSNILLHIPGILIPTEKKHKGLLEELFFQRKISLSLTKKKKWIQISTQENHHCLCSASWMWSHLFRVSSGEHPSDHTQSSSPVRSHVPRTDGTKGHLLITNMESVPPDLYSSSPLCTCHVRT